MNENAKTIQAWINRGWNSYAKQALGAEAGTLSHALLADLMPGYGNYQLLFKRFNEFLINNNLETVYRLMDELNAAWGHDGMLLQLNRNYRGEIVLLSNTWILSGGQDNYSKYQNTYNRLNALFFLLALAQNDNPSEQLYYARLLNDSDLVKNIMRSVDSEAVFTRIARYVKL